MPKKKPNTRQTLEAIVGRLSEEEWRRICAVPTARAREVLAAAAPTRRRSPTGQRSRHEIQYAARYM